MTIFVVVTIQKNIMAKKKKAVKAKEPIRLRFKELANGNKSLYLDIYRDGKRQYEFLKLYLIPETDETAKARNLNTLQAANAIKAQKIIELTNDEAGVTKNTFRSKMLLIDWMKHYSDHKLKTGQSAAFHVQIDKAIKHLIKYKGETVTMKEVDKAFCLGFIDYLNNAKRKDGKLMAKVTTAGYFRCLNCALNLAVKEEIIPYNPITKINSDDRIKIPESTNIGTANSGKESIPPNIARIMYSGEIVKLGSNIDGAKETILRVDDIGTDNNRSPINNINTTMANIIFPPLDLDQ